MKYVSRSPLPLLVLLLCLGACPDDEGNGFSDGNGGSRDGAGPDWPNVCPTGQPSITGRALAPNGLDPLSGALVYVARGKVPALPAGNVCQLCNQLTNAWVQATSSPKGDFILSKVPAGKIEVVVQVGRFRRIIPVDAQCGKSITLTAEQTRLPRNPKEGDVPKIAVATGQVDHMEYVLTKIGVEEYELFEGRGSSSTKYPLVETLLADPAKLAGYHIVLLNCAIGGNEKLLTSGTTLKNLQDFVNSGGRLFVDDLSYEFIEWPFARAIDFEPDPTGAKLDSALPQEPVGSAEIGYAATTISATVQQVDLKNWLGNFPDTIATDGTVPIDGWLAHWAVMHAGHTTSTVWVQGPASFTGGSGTRPFSVSSDPVGPSGKRCGRVAFNSYHTVPDKASATAPFNPQERILEYLFFKVAGCPGLE